MSRFKNVRRDGHRHDGPRHGRGARPRRHGGAHVRHQRRAAIEARQGHVRASPGACSTSSRRPTGGGGSVSYATDVAEALDGAEIVDRGRPREARAQEARSSPSTSSTSRPTPSWPRTRRASRSRRSPRTCRAPGARHRHALVQPAAPHPHDRGHPRREDLAGRRSTPIVELDRRRRLRTLARQEGGPGLRREPHPLRHHARVPGARRRAASSISRSSTSTSSGASATSSR